MLNRWICGSIKTPTSDAYHSCLPDEVGDVWGSVSITKPKNSAALNSRWRRLATTSPPVNIENNTVAATTTTKNVVIICPRRILRTIRTPPITTNGTITGVPIHQLGVCCAPYVVSTTATAAGLKICLRLIAKMYFDTMASPAAASKNSMFILSRLGVIINAKINAVMTYESELTGAENIQAISLLNA